MLHEKELKEQRFFVFNPGDETRRKNHYLKINRHGKCGNTFAQRTEFEPLGDKESGFCFSLKKCSDN